MANKNGEKHASWLPVLASETEYDTHLLSPFC